MMAEKEEEKYEVLEKIGQGSFGVIRKVRLKTTNQILCRKEISYSRMSDKEKNQLHAELRILESLRHPNIVQYCHREHLKLSHDLHLYMEYCGNGDLGGYVKKLKERNQYADEDFVWNIFAQLVCALYRCHYGEDPPAVGEEGKVKNGKSMIPLQTKEGHRMILHRDLKPENVFLGENNSVKLGDFGLSKIIASHDFASTYVGTPFYMSPEICAAERYSHHSDIWSLGCIIYELASRCVPFDARNHVELIMKIKGGKIKPLPSFYSHELFEVIKSCLKVDPRNRPDTAQLLNVANIKLARRNLDNAEQGKSALAKLAIAHQQILDLQAEVAKLKEAGKRVEMEWHARATLAIDQRVHEQVEAKKAELLEQFETAVDQRAEQKLSLHLASLPASHGLVNAGESTHVRSSTPPPGAGGGGNNNNNNKNASFATVTTGTTAASSWSGEESAGGDETDLTSLSLQDDQSPVEEEEEEDVSPLAQRTKPLQRAARKPLGRAKTFANCNLHSTAAVASPMDVHMADPSPMVSRQMAPMSIKGLSLSPRKNNSGHDRLSSNLRRNIFQRAAGTEAQALRPRMAGETQGPSFADEDDEDDEDQELIDDGEDNGFDNSPSRPSSGLSDRTTGDPFKAFALPQPTKPRLSGGRPSLTRQQTMPVNLPQQQQRMHQPAPTGMRPNIFHRAAAMAASNNKPSEQHHQREKENRPPSSHADAGVALRSALPTISAASPKRLPQRSEGKILTPSRMAPPPPVTASSHLVARRGNSPSKPINSIANSKTGGIIQGRTLVQLQEAKSQPSLLPPENFDDDGEGMANAAVTMGGQRLPRLLPSPAKWDVMVEMGEEMPSPFLARKGRMVAAMR